MSDAGRFTGIRIGFFEPSPGLWQSLPQMIKADTGAELVEMRSQAAMREAIEAGRIDALLLDADGVEAEAEGLVRDVRKTGLGPDPFMVVIIIHPHPGSDKAQKIRLAGADVVIQRPAGTDELTQYLADYRDGRRWFVVAGPYAGPEHRKAQRPGQSSELIDAPNRLGGEVIGDDAMAQARAMWQRMLELRGDS
jgi:enoyl-CoA hydratase/carnithine racemase